jgi:hypothetical protein
MLYSLNLIFHVCVGVSLSECLNGTSLFSIYIAYTVLLYCIWYWNISVHLLALHPSPKFHVFTSISRCVKNPVSYYAEWLFASVASTELYSTQCLRLVRHLEMSSKISTKNHVKVIFLSFLAFQGYISPSCFCMHIFFSPSLPMLSSYQRSRFAEPNESITVHIMYMEFSCPFIGPTKEGKDWSQH